MRGVPCINWHKQEVVMKFERIRAEEIIRTDNALLAGNPVGIVGVNIVLEERERKQICELSQRVADSVLQDDRWLEGFVRIDYAPKISRNGDLELVGVLEVNGHGLECVSAGAALAYAYPDMISYDAPAVFAQCLQEKASGKRIIFLPGLRSKTKQAWRRLYFRDLQRVLGDQIEYWSEGRFQSQWQLLNTRQDLIYRWGDCRPWPGGVCEYGLKTCWDLIVLQDRGIEIINPVWRCDDDDPSSKRHLVSDEPLFGRAVRLTADRWDWCLNHKERLVLKATGSGEGNGVVCGKDVDDTTWQDAVGSAICSGAPHIIQKYMALPTINVCGIDLVMDFNVMGWIDHQGTFTYLGFIARAATLKQYAEAQGRINVSQGGGTGFFPLGR